MWCAGGTRSESGARAAPARVPSLAAGLDKIAKLAAHEASGSGGGEDGGAEVRWDARGSGGEDGWGEEGRQSERQGDGDGTHATQETQETRDELSHSLPDGEDELPKLALSPAGGAGHRGRLEYAEETRGEDGCDVAVLRGEIARLRGALEEESKLSEWYAAQLDEANRQVTARRRVARLLAPMGVQWQSGAASGMLTRPCRGIATTHHRTLRRFTPFLLSTLTRPHTRTTGFL